MATRTLNAESSRRTGERWSIRRAGSFAIIDEFGRDLTPRGRKARALIAHLAAQAGEPVPRDKLMHLLWGDRGEAQARSSLRQALFEVRSTAGELIRADRDLLWIEGYRVTAHGDPHCGEVFEDLNHITPEFDAWLKAERERHSTQAWDDLYSQVERLLATGRGVEAIPLVERMQRLDPYNEDWLRLAMQAEFQAGHPAAIDKRFRDLADLLRRDLDVSPAAETRALRDKLLRELTRQAEPSPHETRVIKLAPPIAKAEHARSRRGLEALVVAALLLLGLTFVLRWLTSGSDVPVVAVGPAEQSSRSQDLSRDLLVKLGTLADVGSGRWRLVDAVSSGGRPDLVFRVTETRSGGDTRADLILLGGRDNAVLWAREFRFDAARESDLRQAVSLTAGRVLGCALEARQTRGLRPDLLKLFLTGCAASAETSDEEPQKIVGMMRPIVNGRPDFAPAWALLLRSDLSAYQIACERDDGSVQAERVLRGDLARAQSLVPGLPAIGLVQVELLPPTAYAEQLRLLAKIRAQAPENPDVWVTDSNVLAAVGRMAESIAAARRAAQLDPLSPRLSSNLIQALAWGGATDAARTVLHRAERLWAGTGTLRDAQWAFHLRYGDPRIAQKLLSEVKSVNGTVDPYLQARLDPSPANVTRLVDVIRRSGPAEASGSFPYAIQALGEFHRTDEVYRWLQREPVNDIADASYLLFRPAMTDVRRDPRFMQVAQRIGLVNYWQNSGNWPDFCSEPRLPYNCSREAAKLGATPPPRPAAVRATAQAT